MADTDHTWDWLDQAAKDARNVINRLYHEGHTQLFGAEPDAVPPAPDGPATDPPAVTDVPS